MKQNVRLFIKKVLCSLESLGLQDGDDLLLAYSGGVDSAVLLDLLCLSIPEYTGFQVKITAAHLCHLIRPGCESEKSFLKKQCQEAKCAFVWEKEDVPASKLAKQLGVEGAGRILRYQFFNKLAAKKKLKGVMLAQHLDDRVETFLDRLVTGASLENLDSLEAKRELGIKLPGKPGIKKITIYRPLLEVSKLEILAYAKDRNLEWLEDETNKDTKYRRNKIRHELLPLLKEFNPAIVERIAFLGDQIKQVRKVNRAHYAKVSKDCLSQGLFGTELCLKEWDDLPDSTREPLILDFLSAAELGRSLNQKLVKSVLSLAHRKKGRLSLPRGWQALVNQERLFLFAEKELAFKPIKIKASGKNTWKHLNLKSEVLDNVPGEGLLKNTGLEFYADKNELRFPLSWRVLETGEKFIPFGKEKPCSVSTFLKKEQVPAPFRKNYPVLVNGDGTILFLAGLRRASFAPVDLTKTVKVFSFSSE